MRIAKAGHSEMPIARQVNGPGIEERLFLNQENTITDIDRYSSPGRWGMAHRIFLCFSRKIMRLNCYGKWRWYCCRKLQHLQTCFGKLLVGIVFKEFMDVLAAVVGIICLLIHTAFFAGFRIVMPQPPVCQLAHAVMHLQSSTCGSADV